MNDMERAVEVALKNELDPIQMHDSLPRITRRAKRERFLFAAAGVSIALVAGLGGLWVITSLNMSQRDRDMTHPAPQQASPSNPTFGGWAIEVRVRPRRLGPLNLLVGTVRRAPRNDAQPWVRHHLTFRNLGERSLRMDDTRTSVFLRHQGNPTLLAADEGCGYGRPSSKTPVEDGACQDYLDAFVVPPKGSVKREITLFKSLPGMEDLAEGTYAFRKEIRFRIGSDRTTHQKTITILYKIRRDQT